MVNKLHLNKENKELNTYKHGLTADIKKKKKESLESDVKIGTDNSIGETLSHAMFAMSQFAVHQSTYSTVP